MEPCEFVVVLVTAGSADEAEHLAHTVVDERLAACVNIVGPIRSVYRWQGQVEQAEERLLIIKTRRLLFDALSQRVKETHSYSTPEIIALDIEAGASDYLRWLAENCRDTRS